MAGKVVTLSISDSSLKLLVAKGKKIKQWADLPLEPGLVKDGVVLDEPEVAARIKKLLKAEGVRTKKVVAGLSGLRCFSRLISVPELSHALLPEAIRQETERIMTVPMEQFYLTWQIIAACSQEKQIFVVALPCDAADALVKTLRQAGVEPYLMDIKPLALARAVDQATAIIVDVQSTEFDVVVMVDGIPQPARTISLPHSTETWPEKLPIIAQELDKTIKFYDSSHPKDPLTPETPVFVSGELPLESEAFQSLASELKHPVLPLSSPLKCPPGLSPNQYMANIGLALKKISGRKALHSKVYMNVLPDVYRPKAPSLINMFVPPGMVVVIGLLAFWGMLIQNTSANIGSLRAQLDAANQLLNQKYIAQQSQEKNIARLEKEAAAMEIAHTAFTSTLNSFDSNHTEVNGDLAVAISTLPGTVKLGSIGYAASGLTIHGVAPSEDEVLAYATALRASGRFSQVIISSIRSGEGGMSFNFTLNR